MDGNNILQPNLLLNDPDMAQGLQQGPVQQQQGQQQQAAALAGGQPHANAGAQAVNDLADLIDQVVLAPALPPPVQPRVVPRPLDRPLAMAEEQLPLRMVRNEIQREAQTLDLLGRLTRLVTADHANLAAMNDPQRNQLHALLQGMGDIQQHMHNNQLLLQNAQLKAKRYRNAIEMPEFLQRQAGFVRYPQDVSGKNIKNNAPVFNPKVPGADFRVTWHRLKDYGDQNFFDEREYTVALGQVLEEQAYMEYVQLRENGTGLRGILEHMEEIYVPKNSYYEDQTAVDNFRRNNGENIHKAMRRALLCVEKLRHSVPDNDWPVLLKKYMEDILFKIVSPSTQKYLRKLNEVYTESGLTYDLHTMIQKADMHEVTNDAAPKTEMPCGYAQNVSALEEKVYPTLVERPTPMDTSNSYSQRSNNPRAYERPKGSDWYNRDNARNSQYSPDNRNRSRDRQTGRNQSLDRRDSSRTRFNPAYDNNRDNRSRSTTNSYNGYGRNDSHDRSKSYQDSNRNSNYSNDRNRSRDRYRDRRSNSRDRSKSRDRNRSYDRNRDNRSSSRDQYRSGNRTDSNFRNNRYDSRDRRNQTPTSSDPSPDGGGGKNTTNAKGKAVNIVLKDKSYYSCALCSSLHPEDRCPLTGNR